MVRPPKSIQWWWSSQKPLKRHWNQWLGSPKTMVIVQRCQNHWGCAKLPERLINTSHCQQHEWFPSGLWHRGRGEQPAGKLDRRIPTGSGRSAHCRGHLRTCQPSKSQLLANIKKLKGRCSAHDNHRNLLIFLYWRTIQITIELKFVMEDDDHDSTQDRDDQKRVDNHGVMWWWCYEKKKQIIIIRITFVYTLSHTHWSGLMPPSPRLGQVFARSPLTITIVVKTRWLMAAMVNLEHRYAALKTWANSHPWTHLHLRHNHQ